jgi:hypothetical protein
MVLNLRQITVVIAENELWRLGVDLIDVVFSHHVFEIKGYRVGSLLKKRGVCTINFVLEGSLILVVVHKERLLGGFGRFGLGQCKGCGSRSGCC